MKRTTRETTRKGVIGRGTSATNTALLAHFAQCPAMQTLIESGKQTIARGNQPGWACSGGALARIPAVRSTTRRPDPRSGAEA